MKPPKKIYLTTGDYEHPINFEDDVDNGNVLWCQDKVTKHDVEYIRKDLYDNLKERYNTLKLYAEHPWGCQMGT